MVILNQTQTTREDQSSYGNWNIYLKNVKGAPSSNEPLCDKGSFEEFKVLEKMKPKFLGSHFFQTIYTV